MGCRKNNLKADLQAIGGDVESLLQLLLVLSDQCVLKPVDYDAGWVAITDSLTSDTEIRKEDGFIYVKQSQTTVSFVIGAAAIETLGDSGIGFQVHNVTVNSAELTAGAPEAAMRVLVDEKGNPKNYCMEYNTYEELAGVAAPEETTAAPEETTAAPEETTAAPAEETTAPAGEETTAAPAETSAAPVTTTPPTGNAPIALAIIPVALCAAVIAKKAK